MFPGVCINGKCINTPGSFFCQCPPGMTVDISGRTCIGVYFCLSACYPSHFRQLYLVLQYWSLVLVSSFRFLSCLSLGLDGLLIKTYNDTPPDYSKYKALVPHLKFWSCLDKNTLWSRSGLQQYLCSSFLSQTCGRSSATSPMTTSGAGPLLPEGTAWTLAAAR